MGISRLYRAGTPYNASELADLDYEQTADVMYFAHLDHAPQKLVRTGHTNWSMNPVTFGPVMANPTDANAVATTPNTTGYHAVTYYYVITAIDDETGQESRASSVTTAINDLTLDGNYNTITWTAVTGAERYTVYKSENGSNTELGYIGTTTGTSFIDRNVAADMSDTPPTGNNPFNGEGFYPSTVTFFEQRLMWARSRNRPNAIYGSQSANFENMDTSRPAKPDDAVTFGLAGRRVNAVNQLVGMKSLLALTSDGVFAINGGSESAPLTPSAIVPRQQNARGSTRLNPLLIDSTVFFRPSQGSSVRTLGYTFEIDGFKSDNVAIFSPHLFDGFEIRAWAYQQEPFSIVWAARSDGVLLAFTWEQEQQVWGWTRCETNGLVEDVCVITEAGMDRVYLAVRRTLAGEENVFIERMALPLLTAADLPSACYLDCAYSQSFETPSTKVGELWHLETETVTAFMDGNVVTGLVVNNGQITLPHAASLVTVGLPFEGEIEPLPMAFGGEGAIHTARQMTGNVVVRVTDTRGLKVGVRGGEFYELMDRDSEPLGDPIALSTQDFHASLDARWSDGATVVVRQEYPLPATITALFPDTSIGR